MVPKTPNIEHLIPEKHLQTDLFVCDVADAVFKDLMAQMEHPFYSLSKKPETNVRRYEHNGNWLEITPSVKGLATIYDKDILIYCVSQLMAKLNRGERVTKRLKICCYDLLIFTNRGTAGKDYKALSNALSRLAGTTISTNIRINEKEEEFNVFNLIDSATLRREFGFNGRLVSCTITLSDWVFDAIRANEVLTLHRDYFRLRKPIERRVYEVARKHCGQQDTWSCNLKILYKKSGSRSPLKKFRFFIQQLVKNDYLPDYSLSFDTESDKITFYNRGSMPTDNATEWEGILPTVAFEKLENLNLSIDKYQTENEFRAWLKDKEIVPENPTALFLSFAKKKAEKLKKAGVIPYRTR